MHLKHSYPTFIFWFGVGWVLGIFPAVAFVAGFTMGTKQTSVVVQNTKLHTPIVAGAEIVATDSADISPSSLTPTSIPTIVVTPVEVSPIPKSVVGTSPLWEALNAYRVNHELTAFVRDNDLCQVSLTRLAQIRLNGLNHDGFNAFLTQYLQKGFKKLGETLSHGYSDAEEIIRQWDVSPMHQAILTDGAFNRACEAFDGGYAVIITGQK